MALESGERSHRVEVMALGIVGLLSHGIRYCWTFKTKAVVKISFLLLFLTRHFFFANTMFLRFVFFYIHNSVFQ